jgi:hypothetical protein
MLAKAIERGRPVPKEGRPASDRGAQLAGDLRY